MLLKPEGWHVTFSREEYQYVFKRAIDITICIIILYGIMDIYMMYVVAPI